MAMPAMIWDECTCLGWAVTRMRKKHRLGFGARWKPFGKRSRRLKRNFTFDEINLMCIYNTGTRAGLMQALTDMRGQLEPDEAELLELTDSALRKLGRITDEQFVELELVPDFD